MFDKIDELFTNFMRWVFKDLLLAGLLAIILVAGLYGLFFSGGSLKNGTEAPGAIASNFIDEEQAAEIFADADDSPFVENEDDFISEDEMEDENPFKPTDIYADNNGFSNNLVAFRESYIKDDGTIGYKDFDSFGNEIKYKKKLSTDEKIAALENKIEVLQSRLSNDDDSPGGSGGGLRSSFSGGAQSDSFGHNSFARNGLSGSTNPFGNDDDEEEEKIGGNTGDFGGTNSFTSGGIGGSSFNAGSSFGSSFVGNSTPTTDSDFQPEK